MSTRSYQCGAVLLCIVLCRTGLATGAPPHPWNFTSKGALKAKTDYERTVREARMQLIKDLEAAQDEATKSADLDEAVKIKNSIELLKKGEDPPRKFKLQQQLKGSRWAWGKKFDDLKIRLIFGDNTYSMVEPKRTSRGRYQVTSKWSVRLDGQKDLIFSRDLRRFVFIDSKGAIRTGLRLR